MGSRLGFKSTALAVTLGFLLAVWGSARPDPVQAASAQAGEPADLCAIPFTEAYRDALVDRHIPALIEVLEHWRDTGPEDSRISALDKRSVDEHVKHLLSFSRHLREMLLIRSAGSADPTLPRRVGPANPQSAAQGPLAEPEFELDADRKMAVHDATQALQHWSCRIDEPDVFAAVTSRLMAIRGDYVVDEQINPLESVYPLTFADWKQWTRVAYSHMHRFPEPSAERISAVATIPHHILNFSWPPSWWDFTDEIELRREFQRDLTDWALSGSGPLSDRIHAMANGIIPSSRRSGLDLNSPVVLDRIHAAYAADTSDVHVSPIDHVHLEAAMAYVWARSLRPYRAACFILRMGHRLKDPHFTNASARSALDQVKLDAPALLMSTQFGPDWQRFDPFPSPCL